LTTAANGLEADMICGALRSAGIEATTLGHDVTGRGAPRTLSTAVYVRKQDLQRARAALTEATATSETELTELSESSAPPPD
jgi:hypothetical protein